ncbi:MAG: 3-oxoacyl-ACP synthase III [Planctomycetaceae bacterium]
MRYRHVCVESITTVLPPHVVTSDEIEEQLHPVYERLRLPAGRLELMTGIRERRFYDPGTLPGKISAQTVRRAIELSGIHPRYFQALIHGSVSRDQMEPATANFVHDFAELPDDAVVLDVSNACLGLLNGMLILADMIELGHVRAGIVVGTEVARGLVEGTIDRLLNSPDLTRKEMKGEFASLTIGSGSAAIVLCDDQLSQTGNRLVAAAIRSRTSAHRLCAGGISESGDADHRPRMQTDSEALLHAGVELAAETWEKTRQALGWKNVDVNCIFTHQVGRAHRKLLLEQLGLDASLDFPTVEFLGNTGAVALPTAFALGIEQGQLQPGHKVACLGIGSGLNSVMLGIEWQKSL